MPREIAHCHIATNALLKIDSLGEMLQGNKSLKSSFLLGAISPDSAYYNLTLFNQGNRYADLFHGTYSYDSFDFIKKFLSLKNSEAELHFSFFFLGVVSHILLDSYWHPFIFKITGDYNHINPLERTNARARHRRLETLIDQLLLNELELDVNNFRIGNFITEVEQYYLNETNEKLSTLLNGKKTTMIKTWKWHAKLQDIFIGNLGGKFRNSPFLKREIRSLFNSHNSAELFQTKSIIEQHNELLFSEWIDISTKKLSLIFKRYEDNPDEFLLNFIGPSAITGQIGTEGPQIIYELDNRLLEGY